MKGRIVDILPMKAGKGFPVDYQQVNIVLEDGTWAKTYICPFANNARFWSGKLHIGAILGDLHWKNETKRILNADARPSLLDARDFREPPEKPKKPDPQLTLL